MTEIYWTVFLYFSSVGYILYQIILTDNELHVFYLFFMLEKIWWEIGSTERKKKRKYANLTQSKSEEAKVVKCQFQFALNNLENVVIKIDVG